MDQVNIKDIKGPLSFQANYTLLVIILAIVIISILIFLIIYLIKKRAALKTRIVHLKKAHEIAYEALDLLTSRDLPGNGLIKDYYFEISDIARAYIENRFLLKAPEMTTEEFLYSLRDSDILTNQQKDIVKEFLTQCDLVKFAKYGPTKPEIEASFDTVKRLVDETRAEDEEKNNIK